MQDYDVSRTSRIRKENEQLWGQIRDIHTESAKSGVGVRRRPFMAGFSRALIILLFS